MVYEIILGREEKDQQKWGTYGTVLIGKHFVKMGAITALSQPVYLDLNKAHVVFVCGKRGCLTENTQVLTNNGQKPIKVFNQNTDKVWTYDLKNDTFYWTNAQLLKYPVLPEESLLRIELENSQVLTMTREHPLLMDQGGKKVWKKARDMKVGDAVVSLVQLATIDGNSEQEICVTGIQSITLVDGITEVYDLHVPTTHSFIANGVISHNSGKSYCMGVIAEGIANLPEEMRNKLSVIMLDTMGIYWTMKFPNHKDESLLKEWGYEGKGLTNVKVYTPYGFFQKWKDEGIPTDKPFALNPAELSPEDWNLSFELESSNPAAVFIERIILQLKKTVKQFDIPDIIKAIDADAAEDKNIKNAAKNRFISCQGWGLFSPEATPVKDLAEGGTVSILDLSPYVTMPNGWRIKQLVMGIVCMKLFIERMLARKNEEFRAVHQAVHYILEEHEEPKEKEMPIVWVAIDEAHEFLPFSGKVASSDALITLLREGRQPGIAMVMATQQPGKIHTDAMTQSDIILSHRLTAKIDTDALGALLQSYLRTGLDKELANLPRMSGTCIAVDDVNERMYPMRIRPRFSWHGGGAPAIIQEKKEAFKF
ncbi:DUF87 domain-containing protein [Candidatus Woesearchaeota archaeon]|nr:DUF87 domain-containing protein [Candidatus Woesearchaeota archaeon]